MSRFAWAAMLLCLAAWSWAGESTVRWQHASPTVVEGSGPLTNYLHITPPPGSAVTVGWQTTQETAIPGQHYVAFSGTVVIPAGQVRTPVTVDIVNDAFNAGPRTVGMQITSVTGGAGWGNPNYVSATITDDDTTAPPATAPAAAWAPASTSVASGAGPTAFNLALAYAWTQPVSVQWQTNPHSAVPGSDYASAGGIITFAPGETVKPAVVDILAGAQAGREFGLQILTITGGAWGNPNYQAITIIAGPPVPVATPVITPAAGTYQLAVTATASTTTAGAVLRYRLDGGDPGAGDPLLPADGLIIDAPSTLAVRGFADGALPSATATAAYAFAVAPVTADLAAGTYTGAQSVTLATASTGAEIRYTLDGSAPTAASALASGPIGLPGSCTLKAQAMRSGWTSSAVFSAVYQLRVPTPVLAPAPGTYSTPQTVTATVALADAVLRYTTDGTNPTATSTLWPAGGLFITQTTALRVRAFSSGWLDSAVRVGTYTLRVASITADPRGGTYIGERSVVLATTTPGAVIRYTVDGTAPDGTSPIFTGPIALTATTTVRAVASLAGWRDSAAFRATYTLQVAPVVADLASGTYVGPRSVSLSCVTAGSEIRYTLDGSVPGASSALFTGPIVLPGTTVLRAVAMRAGWRDSAILRRSYTLRVEPITPSLPAGTYIGEQQVVLASPAIGATIHYTLDGSVPTAASPVAAGPILLSGNTTLRAVAIQAGWSNSAGFSAAYKLRVPSPVLTPDAGTYAAWPLVTASSSDPSATIRYRLGATMPGSGSPVFPAGGLQLTQPTTINLVATRTGWTISLPYSAAYAVNLPPVVTGLDLATDEDVALAVAPTAVDGDSAVLAWSIASHPSHGALSAFDAQTGAVTYTPAADWNGADTFVLTVGDGLSVVALPVAVTVLPVDDPAQATLPAVSALPGSDAVLDVTAADADSAVLIANLTMQGGSVRLPGAAGLVVVSGDPAAGSAQLTVSGSAEAVCAALRAVVVRTDESFVGGSLELALGEPSGIPATWSVPVAALTPAAFVVSVDGETVVPAIAAARRMAGDRSHWVDGASRLSTTGYPIETTGDAPAALEFDLDVVQPGTYVLWIQGGAAAPAQAGMRVSIGASDHGAVALGGVLPEVDWANRQVLTGGETLVAFTAAGRHRLRVEAPATMTALAGILLFRDDLGFQSGADPWLPDGDGATVVIDAGAPNLTTGAAGGRWQVGALGGRTAVRALPDVDRWSDPAVPAEASAAFDVVFMRAGTYRVWLLGDASDDRANSVHLGLDGQPDAGARGLSWLGLPGWQWSSWSSWSTVPTITVPTAGLHRVNLWSREDGSAISQIRLSLVQSWTMPAAAVATTPQGLPFVAAGDGSLALSAGTAHEARASGATAWAPMASGSATRQLLPDSGLFFGTAQASTSPRLSWHAWFPAAGTYRFWVRAVAPAATGDSLFFGLDAVPGGTDLSWLPVDPALSAWGWSSRLGGTGANATITIPSAGYHTVNIWAREDGLALDRVLIRPAQAAAPSGAGPQDSEQALPAPSVAN